jgi:hypothetical protein
MAGGIDWFRWHHGSVTDPKFGLIAKRAGVRVSDVIAMWAFVLETASSDADRGTIGQLDYEAIEHLLGLEDGQSFKILDAMAQRGLIEGSRIASWDKRQPKRERDTDSSAERTRQYRERQRDAVAASNNHVTPCDATEHQKNARGEERREEEIDKEEPTVLVDTPAANRPPACPTEQIVDRYHQRLPTLPRVEVLNDTRKRHIAARWREVLADPDIAKSPEPRAAALEFFDWYFEHAAKSRFLTGRSKDWRADIDFLMTSSKFAKVIEGHYHKEHA